MAYKVEKFKLFNCDVEVWHYTCKPSVIYIMDGGKVLKIHERAA